MGSAQRHLFDIRRVWGANVQEQRFVEVLKQYLNFDLLTSPEFIHGSDVRSYYSDLFDQHEISVLIAPPDILSMRFYLRHTPAFVSTFHSVGHIEVIRQLIEATITFAPEFDRFVVGSKDAATAIQKIGSRFQCSVLPTYGVYTPIFKHISMDTDTVREKYGIPLHDQILLYVGRVSRQKNVQELIRMFKVIHTRLPATSLLIAGPIDPLTTVTEQQNLVAQLRTTVTELHLNDAVFFTFDKEEFIRPRDLSSIYNVCDIFLYPTIYSQETRGIAPIEAQWCGKPVIATSWDGLRDSIIHGKTGYLVDVYRTANYPVFDFYKFIQYTLYLLRHPALCRQMGEAARQVAEQFTMEHTATRFAAIVQECKEHYESRHTDPPYLYAQLKQKAGTVFAGRCAAPYLDLLDAQQSVEESIHFGFIPQNLTFDHQARTGTVLWELIRHFATRDVDLKRIRNFSAFVSTTKLVVQPFSEIKGLSSPAIPTTIFWFIPLTTQEWHRFFECFREVDSLPIFTPENAMDYQIAQRLVEYGFLTPLEEPPDLIPD